VEEIKKKGRRAIGVVGNVTKEEDVKALVEKTVSELGSVDIMVANAGIGRSAMFIDMTVDQLDAMFAVNVRGVYLCYKYAALQMIKQGKGGRLIGASSLAGRIGAPGLGGYCATKFAVRGLTQTAAIELRKYGITANAYAPGVINTTLLASFAGGEEDNTADNTKSKNDLDPFAGHPLGSVEMVSSTVAYLVKPENYYINGQTLSIDGGEYLS